MNGPCRPLRQAAAAALLAVAAQGACAQEARDIFKTEIFLTPYSELGEGGETYPQLNGRFLLMTGYTGFFGVQDDNGQLPRSHWSSVQPTAEAALVLQLTRQFSIRTKATFNSSTNDTKDNAFSDLGVDLDNLFAAYTADNYALYGGKMDLGFGDAWHVVDGLYTGFNENSEFRGSIGVGGRYTLDTAGRGTHSVAAMLFKRDNTAMNRRFSLDGGLIGPDQPPLFSDQLKSFILSYDFRDLPGLEGWSGGVDAGRLHLDPDQGKSANTVSARLRYDAPLANSWNLSWFNEATYSSAFRGAPVSNGNGVTSVSLSRDRWQLTATAAVRKLSGSGQKLAQYGLLDDTDWGISGAVTYVTPMGFIVQAGLTHQRDQALRINQGVFRIAYQAGF
ncbi:MULTISPECIES: hypothetical protein [Achromobacter]|uniref:Porin n=1 Tax=Achromobacter aegrifaciens TaxID=1287736 RepID=A0AAD2IX63_ACHAE|nr:MULTISPECIES: hypothetical protein [Achromobacter]CAB3812237.1 hypothetical protein LMG26854_00324 [Achromobacter aegrifaciens]CUI72332.1 Uncharacterised protein [Achromobacter aegrifaciens]